MDIVWFKSDRVRRLVNNSGYKVTLHCSSHDGYTLLGDNMKELKPEKQIVLRKSFPGHIQVFSKKALTNNKSEYLLLEVCDSRISVKHVDNLP